MLGLSQNANKGRGSSLKQRSGGKEKASKDRCSDTARTKEAEKEPPNKRAAPSGGEINDPKQRWRKQIRKSEEMKTTLGERFRSGTGRTSAAERERGKKKTGEPEKEGKKRGKTGKRKTYCRSKVHRRRGEGESAKHKALAEVVR